MSWKKIILLTCLIALFSSCGARKSRTTAYYEEPEKLEKEELLLEEEEISPEEDLVIEEAGFDIIEFAKDFIGTKYRYGGINHEGMDCSGLVFAVFSQLDVEMPRSSREMATRGEELDLSQVDIGDLLFFQTNRKRKVINHVGLVVELAEEMIYFIHSTTSRGVIISTLDEKYWKEHFVMARRIL